MQEKVVFKSYNPYEIKYPNRKIISREVLLFIKLLRSEGIETVVEPDDDKKLEYLTQKGFRQFLSDPIVVLLLGIPIGIFVNYVYDWIKNILNDYGKDTKLSNLLIEQKEGKNKVYYSQTGQVMSSKKIADIIKSAKKLQNNYKKSISVKSPKPDILPYPIYLEHTHEIVGWGNISPTKDKLLVSPIKITDSFTKQKIQQGEIKGLSIGGIVKQSNCSICKQDYVNCNHIAGRKYEDKKCINHITAIDLVEISLVKEPVNPEALIKFKANKE